MGLKKVLRLVASTGIDFWIFQYYPSTLTNKSRDSAVGIAPGYGLDSHLGRVIHFHFAVSSRPTTGPTHLHNECVLGVKRPRCGADHPSLTSAEVKKTWMYTATSPIRLHDVVLS
jgi:hypothetical protein